MSSDRSDWMDEDEDGEVDLPKDASIQTQVEWSTYYTARGLPRYRATLSHPGLNKLREIKGEDSEIFQEKFKNQIQAWEEVWQKKLQAKRKAKSIEMKRRKAELQTRRATQSIEALRSTLEASLEESDALDWEALRSSFPEPGPGEPSFQESPEEPRMEKLPNEPMKDYPKYQPKIGFLDRVFTSRKEQRIEEAKERLESDHKEWERSVKEIQREFAKRHNEWECERERVSQLNLKTKDRYEKQVSEWEERKREYESGIDELATAYQNHDDQAVSEYCRMVLIGSMYLGIKEYVCPHCSKKDLEYGLAFCDGCGGGLNWYTDDRPKWGMDLGELPMEVDVHYNPESKILVVDYFLPEPDQLPKLQEVKFVQSKDEFVEKYLSDSAQKLLYDDLLYQICLSSIQRLYAADMADALESIVFNGWVRSIDKGTGQEINPCVLTVQATREEIHKIDLSKVEPKSCFRALRGVGSSQLYGLAAVAPILRISREDSRFVEAREVVEGIDESTNLAAMDWEDFEHLIREVFEAEFAQAGGEVKVTQASRDRGVDAIAFDPDPIRGGKVVIQAKRYTNVVGVAAVRDLFGTVLNEGATKGILVTTTSYGPDAYEFAKGKPLTLLSGGNLLHLLEKHGRKARIDIREAKKILAEKEE